VAIRNLRYPFDEARSEFVAFLQSQGWPTTLLWLSRDRITGFRNVHWVFRPEELTSDEPSRIFYERVRRGASSIRLDGLTCVDGRTLAYVHDWGRDSRLLNFGVHLRPGTVHFVRSSIEWSLRCLASRLRGESTFLKETAITPTSDQSRLQIGSAAG